MRTRVIVRYVGISLILVAMLMAVSGIVAIHNNCDSSTMPLLFSALVTFITGMYPMIFVRPQANVSTKEGIAIVVISWIMCCLFGMIPYICYGGEISILDAMFESVSGFTTTGASILKNIEALPSGLLFWRASTAWVGGLGIVSIFSLIVPKSADKMSVLSSAELSDITRSQSVKRGKSIVGTMLTVYVILTIACTISLKLTGMRWFDAATNAMSTCSTCGFCVRNESIAAYDSAAVEIIIIVFMALSGISFMHIASLFRGRRSSRRCLSEATRGFLAFLAIGTAVVTISLMHEKQETLAAALREACFQIVSITTTTGFATVDTNVWPSLCVVVLVIASVICGCSGSTSGGMKMDRIVLLGAYIRNGVMKAIHPHRMVGARIDGSIISENTAVETLKFVMLYMAMLVVGAVINTTAGLDIETGVSASIACLGNVGPGFGSVGSMGNYADFPSALKISSAILMIAGRLEIIPLLSFASLFVRRG